MSTVRIPPGRAGRLRLRHRLAVAERGADLLEHKLRALTAELAERRTALAEAERRWQAQAARARAWDDRAAVLGGRSAFDAALLSAPALVTITWRTSMGVRVPAAGRCDLPGRRPRDPTPDGAALILSEAGFRQAVPAAVQAAVEQAAVRDLQAAVTATRRQVRALRRHWIPTLAAALAAVEAGLEQADHEDTVRRTAWAEPGRWTLPGPTGRGETENEEARRP